MSNFGLIFTLKNSKIASAAFWCNGKIEKQHLKRERKNKKQIYKEDVSVPVL